MVNHHRFGFTNLWYSTTSCTTGGNHRSLKNVTPADAYFGRAEAIIKQRERIKRKTIEQRRLQYRKTNRLISTNQMEPNTRLI